LNKAQFFVHFFLKILQILAKILLNFSPTTDRGAPTTFWLLSTTGREACRDSHGSVRGRFATDGDGPSARQAYAMPADSEVAFALASFPRWRPVDSPATDVSNSERRRQRAFGPRIVPGGQFSFSRCKKKKRMFHPIGFQERIQLAAVRGSAPV
jgi:hypothetical protein